MLNYKFIIGGLECSMDPVAHPEEAVSMAGQECVRLWLVLAV